MSRMLRAFLLSLVITAAVTLVAFVLAMFASTDTVSSGGMTASAGGVSERLFNFLLAGSVLLFVSLFLLLRRSKS